MTNRTIVQKTLIFAGIVTGVLVIIHGYCLFKAKHHFELASDYRACSSYEDAAREYQTAIGFYAPFNPYSREAADHMVLLSTEVRSSNPALSRDIDDRLKRSLAGIRSFYQPYAEIMKSRSSIDASRSGDPSLLLYVLSLVFVTIGLFGWRLPLDAPFGRVIVTVFSFLLWGVCLYFC